MSVLGNAHVFRIVMYRLDVIEIFNFLTVLPVATVIVGVGYSSQLCIGDIYWSLRYEGHEAIAT